jgi:predicted HTH domain antitoxin
MRGEERSAAMSKVNVQIEIPERLRGTDRERKLLEKVRKHALEQAVLELYKEREISTGTGAELLGMPLWDFIAWLGKREVSIFPSTEEEITEEMNNVERMCEQFAREKQ